VVFSYVYIFFRKDNAFSVEIEGKV
jgi:hypothetical protein